MSKFNKESQKSVRVVLPLSMYDSLKDRCFDYGDMSKVVRYLLRDWLKNSKNTIRSIYDKEDEEREAKEDEAKEVS